MFIIIYLAAHAPRSLIAIARLLQCNIYSVRALSELVSAHYSQILVCYRQVLIQLSRCTTAIPCKETAYTDINVRLIENV